ncbi:MAG TPA: YkgJ family cysteine cluster protein [Bryobacteraceae bacterium]|nr:YkgJ family cysteine cluster protein [Bryobacteraceae bacterium]
MLPELVTIQQTIDRRVAAIRADRGDWLCSKGCDDCCRNLAAIPEMTYPEWGLLRSACDSLSHEIRKAVVDRLHSLEAESSRPIVCPFLDREASACFVYESRPLACRAYGFYVERGLGLYCHRIRASVDRGELADVVWGNQTTIEAESQKLGPARSLFEWARAELQTITPGSNAG